MKKLVFLAMFALVITLLFPRCAKVVAPTGGPKDTIPPILVASNPKPNATNFKENKLTFEFSEYIVLKDAYQKMLVSPPLKNRPEIKQRGKRFDLEINDTLKENTTYSIYFGDAITDNNEGNAIPNFEFAFSTGPNIDTLSLAGSITNSLTNEPVEGAIIMLYTNNTDSLPYKERPTHVAKSNKKGLFKVNNLKSQNYKVVAIIDGNNDFLYNQGGEQIAFLDSVVPQSFFTSEDYKNKTLSLRSFTEPLPYQLLTGYSRPDSNIIELNFSRKPVGDFVAEPLKMDAKANWFISEPDAEGDTLKLWITNTAIIKTDTLYLKLSYQKTDSLNILHPQIDTLKLLYTPTDEEIVSSKSSRKNKKHKDEQPKKDTLGFSLTCSLTSNGTGFPNIPVDFTIPAPVQKADSSQILIFNETDSIMEPPVSLILDTLSPRIYRFNKDWKTNKSYKLLILPGTFTTVYGKTNDTLKIATTGADPESFGTLKINFTGINGSVIADLTTDKGKIVKSKWVKGNGSVQFLFIEPGKYFLRFTDDVNSNGKWDTGNYLKGIQPERIIPFTEGKNKGEINIRANWDSEMQVAIPKP